MSSPLSLACPKQVPKPPSQRLEDMSSTGSSSSGGYSSGDTQETAPRRRGRGTAGDSRSDGSKSSGWSIASSSSRSSSRGSSGGDDGGDNDGGGGDGDGSSVRFCSGAFSQFLSHGGNGGVIISIFLTESYSCVVIGNKGSSRRGQICSGWLFSTPQV